MLRGLVLGIAVAASGLNGAALAQVAPAPPYYAMDPSSPVTPRAAGPAGQQILENYRSQLLQSQREGLQQNPSGLGREQLQLNRQINGLGPGPIGSTAPVVNAPPPPIPGTVPMPPFNAAPRP
jgi:hypothetical protein